MPVNYQHPQYLSRAPQWDRISDVLAGSDAVKRRPESYLPMLSGHRKRPAAYAAYVDRALWYGATSRTLDALIGTVYRREPQVRLPPRLQPLVANVNGQGDTLYTFSKTVLEEVCSKGRYGILADISSDGTGLPHLVGYKAEDIWSWRTRTVRGRKVVDQIILREEFEVVNLDGFGASCAEQFRVLELDEAGYYASSVYRTVGEAGGASGERAEAVYELAEEPIRARPKPGQPIDYLPFVFLNSGHLRPDTCKPPMLDMADVQVSHYRSSADLEEGRHRLAFPIPVISGVDADSGAVWEVGGDSVWEIPVDAKAYMLEFTGQGLGSLENALSQKERYLAFLGAKMLEGQKKQAETAEALHLRNSGENANLATIARTVSDGFEAVFRILCDWTASPAQDLKFELNQDFYDSRLTAQDLVALVQAVQVGVLPLDDFLYNLKQGEILRPEITIEDARHLLETDRPPLLGQAMALQTGGMGQVNGEGGGEPRIGRRPRLSEKASPL